MFNVERLPHIDPSTISWAEFDYPIQAYRQGDGGWDCGPVIGEERNDNPNMLDYTQFEHVYYWVPGENDGGDWTFLAKHVNGYFVFFNAGCDYTGFDCQGGGTITYGRDGQTMWSFGLTNSIRQAIAKAIKRET